MSTLRPKFLILRISFKNALHRLATKRTRQFLSVENLFVKLQQQLLLQKLQQRQQDGQLRVKQEQQDRQLRELQELFLFLI